MSHQTVNPPQLLPWMSSPDALAYALYLCYCAEIHVSPAAYSEWQKTSESISEVSFN